MHPSLISLSTFTNHIIINDEEKYKEILRYYDIIPDEGTPAICSCGHDLHHTTVSRAKIGFQWRCKGCRKSYSGVTGTIFMKCRLSFSDFFALLFNFITDESTNKGWQNINLWRQSKGQQSMCKKVYISYMNCFREVMVVIACNYFYTQIGGFGMTIELDETFLTRHKYFRGRRTDSMTMTIFGILCREQKKTLFFRVDGKSKKHLWPIVKKFVHPESTVVCTDGGKQYLNVANLIPGIEHKVVIHKDTFVDKLDKSNHINTLENANRWMKKSIKNRRNGEVIDHQIQMWVYRKERFTTDMTPGQKLHVFLQDISMVYPGINGVPLQWLDIVNPTATDVGIESIVNNH